MGHIRRSCPVIDKFCKFCDTQFHHSALCPKKFGYFKDRPTSNESLNTATGTKTETKATELVPKEIKTTVGLIAEAQSTYLTARVKIRNPRNGYSTIVHVLLDCGCGKTFILTRTAKELQLRPTAQINLAVGVFLHPEMLSLIHI